MRLAFGGVLLALLACGGGTEPGDDNDGNLPPPPPPEVGPAAVELIGEPEFEPDGSTYLIMTLSLRNTGGPGVYRVEVWRWGSGPGAEDVLTSTTEPVEVPEGYEETASWQVYSPFTSPPLKYLLVFTRDQGSAIYRQTDRFDFPIPE